MRWLHEGEDIPVQLMRGRGLGSKEPIDYMPDGRDNPAGRAKNRRVEIYFAVRP